MALVDQIYDAVADEECFRALPAMLAAHVGARSCVLFGFDQELTLCEAQASYFSSEMIEFQLSHDIRAWDIWTAYGAHPQRLGRIGNGDEVWDREAFKRTPFYNECFRGFGDDTVAVAGGVIKGGDGYLSLAVHRSVGAPAFDGKEIGQLQAVAPHIFRLLDLRRRLRAASQRAGVLQAALDQVSLAVLAVDAELRVHAANQNAVALLTSGDCLLLRRRRLGVVAPQLHDRLARAVRAAATRSGPQGDAILLPRAGERPALRVVVAPIPNACLALLLMEDPSENGADQAANFATMFDLSAAEAELAVLLTNGCTPEEAAEVRRVRITTVRSQIQNLLLKTEARRVTDLVRLLSRVPRRPDVASPESSGM